MRPGVLPLIPKQSDRFLNGLVRRHIGRRNWNSKDPASRSCWSFFSTLKAQCTKNSHQMGKTMNVEFYKGVKHRLLKRIPRVRPTAFCCREFFLLHVNVPAHKAASVCQFFTQKMLQPFITPPVLSRFISARIFSVPQIENEVKRTPFCGCCWDPRSRNWWIKEGPKSENFRQCFRNCTTAQKPMELILN